MDQVPQINKMRDGMTTFAHLYIYPCIFTYKNIYNGLVKDLQRTSQDSTSNCDMHKHLRIK